MSELDVRRQRDVVMSVPAQAKTGLGWGTRIHQWLDHEEAPIAAEPLLEKWAGDHAGLVHQELGLHAMDARRVLERLDDVGEQFGLKPVAIAAVAYGAVNIQVADDALAALIDEEGVSVDVT